MPRIWRAGRQEGFVTQADYFAARYEAPWLGVLTGVIGIASLVIYVQIQLISLGSSFASRWARTCPRSPPRSSPRRS